MKLNIKNPHIAARKLTQIVLVVMMIWGAVSVLWEVRPFWVDEWRIIYNLKFKSQEELWGGLAFMQQFPRLYLSLLKLFTAKLHYSYFSLRLPSFLIGSLTMWGVYRLANKLYPGNNYNRFLLVLMLVSCGTFTEYFVQIKQYTMDLFLSVCVLWQLVYLQQAGTGERKNVLGYLLFCAGFLIAPFFSYTYAIAVAPVYAVVLVQNILQWYKGADMKQRLGGILRQWVPLFLCTFSITVFYLKDAYQLGADADMKAYWGHLMMQNGFELDKFLVNVFHLFAQAGAGFLYWWLFGVLGCAAFVYAVFAIVKKLKAGVGELPDMLLLYAVLLPILIMVLYVAGKLPVGEPRLNAFAVPALSVLLIHLLTAMNNGKAAKVSAVLSVVLLLGLAGNIFSTIIASFTDSKYARRMDIYRHTQTAIIEAEAQKIPVLITPGVAYPYDNTRNLPFDNSVPGDWVLMTFPAYNATNNVPVYAIDSMSGLNGYLEQLPANVTSVMVGDGLQYRIVKVPRQALPLQ
jgi:hypothetical protein